MKILCGTDIVDIRRMEKHVLPKEDGALPHFVERCFTDKEIEYCMSKKLDRLKAESMAARFAAKEACAKALGTGIMTMGIGFTDIEILKDDKGAPYVVLHNEALRVAEELKIISTSISLSHDGDYAVSFCTMISSAGEEQG